MRELIPVEVTRVLRPHESLVELTLAPAPGTALPRYEPGAHIDLHVAPDLVRQYSLVHDTVSDGYTIALHVASGGRGGSRQIAAQAREGCRWQVSAPRNVFRLRDSAHRKVFIAGGIGITPLHAMVSHLERRGFAGWELHYAYTSSATAYLPTRLQQDDPRVHHYNKEHTGHRLDLAALVAAIPAAEPVEVYCCGPLRMLDEVRALCAGRAGIQLCVEQFEAAPASHATSDRAFEVHLARTGRTIPVRADQSILQALCDAGMQPPSSCQQGICGACETGVLAGTPLHRDNLLSDDEQRGGQTMMICCSRAVGPSLTLDL